MKRYGEHIRLFGRDAWLFLIGSTVLAIGGTASDAYAGLYYRVSGYDQQFLGWIAAASQVGVMLGTIPAFLLVDRIGRHRSIVLGATISLLAWAAAVDSATREGILSCMLLSGMGNAMFGLSVIPLLAELSSVNERTTLFSFHNGVIWLGAFVGGLAVGFGPVMFASWLDLRVGTAESYRAVLLASAAWRLTAMIPMALIRGRDFSHRVVGRVAQQLPGRFVFVDYLRAMLPANTPAALVMLPIVLTFYAISLVQPFRAVYLRESYGAPDQSIGTAIALSSLVIGFTSLAAPLILIRLSRLGLILLAIAITSGSLVTLAYVSRFELAVLAMMLRAGAGTVIAPLFRALVIDAVPLRDHTKVALMMSAAENVGEAIAPPMAGRVLEAGGYRSVFLLAASVCAGSALAFVRACRWSSSSAKKPFGP